MKDILTNKLQNLAIEAEKLVDERANLLNRINDIEVRINQLVGAINEIDKIKKELD